jgi:hypothetical protein
MRKFVLIVFVGMAVFSCKKKNNSTDSSTYTPDCSGTAPGYAATVSSLISANCASSGCHNTGSSRGPGALVTYTQIKNAASSIRSSVVSGSMPQGFTLSDAQKNSIVCWIDAGAANN